MRAVDLAVWADALAGEAASLAAKAERARSRLAQAALERAACAELGPDAVAALERAGVLGRIDARAVRRELQEVEEALAALASLQVWVEARLAAETPGSSFAS